LSREEQFLLQKSRWVSEKFTLEYQWNLAWIGAAQMWPPRG